ncbi:probable ubiquitin-like-specific protease 2A isoform X2 [Cryptomeria japonica]|nr:probable ubiquitin-like-specific protease 2A isoform X2 [Cryptomeria japonica]
MFINLNGENPKESGAQNEVAGNNSKPRMGFDAVGWTNSMNQKIQPVKSKVSELNYMYYKGVLDDEARSLCSREGNPQIDHGTGPTNDSACVLYSEDFSVVLELPGREIGNTCEIDNVGHQDVELVSLLDDEDERDGVCQAGVAGKKARKRGGRLRCRKEIGELDQYLDTHIIDRYMEQIWKKLTKSKKEHCTYLDCLWFSMYLEELTSFKILKWIKAKRIFSKRYVFIPIVHWGHWNLLILCHFGEDLRSRVRTPCMLLLDSLKETDPSRLEPLIRKFLVEVHKGEGRKDSDKVISRFPLLVPEVPQQTNGNDCGVFLLHFIDLFLKQAPDNFSTSEDRYPYFLTKDWFKLRDIRKRRKQINDVLLREQDGTNQMVTRRISTRSKKLNGFLSSGRVSNWIDLSTGA